MPRELSEQERAQLARAQASLTRMEDQFAAKVRRARLARDHRVAELLHFGVSAPAIAQELGVTRAAVYEMARRARMEAADAD